MKRLTTILCCFAFMVSGVMLAIGSMPKIDPGGKTITAATLPFNMDILPLDVQLDLDKRTKSDSIIIHDTVEVTKPKYVKVPQRKRTTDTMYVTMPIPGPIPTVLVNNNIAGDREEYTPVSLLRSKQHSISLTVDGQTVYSTETDIHSTEDRQ